MSAPERIQNFVPIETTPLPRPLHRLGSAFPVQLAEVYSTAYTQTHGRVLDPLAHPLSAADAVERFERRGVATSGQPLGQWARRVVANAPSAADILAALELVGASALGAEAHRVAMRELYASHCPTCLGPVVIEAFLWERDSAVPTKKAFRCGICAREGRALLIEPITQEDDGRARSLEQKGLAYWQFVERFGPAAGRQALAEGVAALYTPRNLTALMGTLRAIETALPDSAIRDTLKLALLEVIVTGSRLNAVAGHVAALRVERGRARRGHAAQAREINVWLEYERTVRELAAWTETRVKPPSAQIDNGLAADLIMFEAPVEDNLGAWTDVATVLLLGGALARPAENADGRLSARERLLRTMRQAFLDGHRGSVPGAPAVIYLPHADATSLGACALAGAGTGFNLRGILFQPDALPTAYGGAAAVLDFDREVPLLKDQPSAGAAGIEEAIRVGVREAILARGAPVSADVAAAAALESLSRRRLLASVAMSRAGGTSEVELFLDHFKSALADGRKGGLERFGTSEPPQYSLLEELPDSAPLDDRVEWGVWGLLAASGELETRAVLRRTYGLFKGIETPDRELVQRCLAAYGVQGDDGRWRLRAEDGLARRQAEQTELTAALITAGHRLGFTVHVGRDLRRRPLPVQLAEHGALLADLMTDAERLTSLTRHMRGAAEVLDAVDVVWYDQKRMTFIWQLDWTARAHRSVVSLGEAIPDDERTFRFLAIADDRRELLSYKLGRLPAVEEVVRRRGWRFVKWGPLKRFASDPAADLGALEPVIGLEPAVEQGGQQLVFRWEAGPRSAAGK